MIALVRSLLAWFMATAVGETGLWKQVFRKTVLLQQLCGKESACHAGDPGDKGSIPELGRPPGEGNGNSPEYPCWENP